MYLLIFLLLFVLLILLLLAVYPVKAILSYNSEQLPDFHLMLSWLYPFLRAAVIRHDNKNFLTLYLFNKKVYSKDLKGGKKTANYTDRLELIRTMKPEHMKLNTSYGFEDPAVTGVVCGAVDLLSEYVNFEVLDNRPDFYVLDSYFNMNASAEFNALSSLIRILKLKRGNGLMQTAHSHK